MATHAALTGNETHQVESTSHTSTSLASTTTSATPVAPVAATADNLAHLRVTSTPKPEVVITDLTSTAKPGNKAGFSPRAAPLPLTGAAVMAEAKRRKQQQENSNHVSGNNNTGNTSHKSPVPSRQTSPNPSVAAMQSLMGVSGISKPADAPAPDKMSESVRKAAEKMHITAESNPSVDSEQVSPSSLGSFGTLENPSSANSLTATANDSSAPGSHFVAEPAQMTDTPDYPVSNGHLAVADQEANKAFSYPGPPQPDHASEGGPSRGMSLPGYGQSSPKSPASSKRHKCPYCSTDFTRHHNLKSHLLTHSQEKPFVCQTCQARFRRLHDLKRHTKLHTGERPHTCDKCGRSFARGDALARHNKGPGGCAGRRSSFGGDDDYGPGGTGDGMDGIDYTGADEDDEDDDEHPDGRDRRESEPSRKRRQLETPQDPNREVYRHHSSTYPPAQHERMRGDMGPPTVVHTNANPATSPRDSTGQSLQAGTPTNNNYYSSAQVFGEPGMMTHSPKPLSPGQGPDQHRLSVAEPAAPGSLGRNRSTSLTTQFQQAHFGRGSSAGGRTPPPSLPPPPPLQQPPPSQQQQQQSLPLPQQYAPGHSVSSLPPRDAGGHAHGRSTAHSLSFRDNETPGLTHRHIPGQHNSVSGSNQGSASSHGRSSGSSSMRDLPGHEQAPQADIWAYARAIEQRFSRMQDEYELRLSRQQEEIISLKGQMAQLIGSYSSDMGGGQRGPPPYPS